MPKTRFYLGDRVNIDGDELILARLYNKDDEETLIFQLISTIDGNRFSDKAVVIAKKDRDGAQWITRTEIIYLLEGDGKLVYKFRDGGLLKI